MANHYIRQDIERRMILLGLTNEEIAVFINVAVLKELNNQTICRPYESAKAPIDRVIERPDLEDRGDRR